MQITKHIISLFLMLTVLCSGFKFFPPEDINRSGRLGLEDVILSLKAFKSVVNAPQELISRVKDIHSTLQINAGLRTIF